MPKPIPVDRTVELPKFGQRIPAERFHVSKLNMRAKEPFGDSERDKQLIENLRRGEVIQPFKAKPEGNGFGVYVGRRRLLAKCALGIKAFVVGKDVLIDNVADEQAREESYVENLDLLREDMNPLLRARATQDLIDSNMAGLRAVARKLGLAPSTLSQWTKILELKAPLQETVSKGQIFYKDALNAACMKLTEAQQEKLAEAAETGGRDAFIAQMETIQTGQEKRGIPKGKYIVERIMFERAHEQAKYDELQRLAKAKNMEVSEYIKELAIKHIEA